MKIIMCKTQLCFLAYFNSLEAANGDNLNDCHFTDICDFAASVKFVAFSRKWEMALQI